MNMHYTVRHIRGPIKEKSSDWKETADQWLFIINGQTFDYFAGIRHRKPIKSAPPTPKNVRSIAYEQWRSTYVKPVAPGLDDLLYSILTDGMACDMSFKDWCADFGYDTDSRTALETYLACQENALKLRKAGINIADHAERLQDY